MNLGFNKRDRCYYGKYKDPEKGWKTKFIPVSCSSEQQAQEWFTNFLNTLDNTGATPTNVEVKKKVHTISTLFPLWAAYVQEVRTNRNGNPLDLTTKKSWQQRITCYVLGHSIAAVPLTTEAFTPVLILGWVEEIKARRLSKSTTKDIVMCLRTMIGDARKKGWITLTFNPVADEIVKSEVPAVETVAGAGNPIHLSKEAACQLMACGSVGIPLSRKVKNVLALCSGARSAEMQGLAWRHVDVKARTLTIDRQLKKGGETPRFGRCKAGSERTVPLHHLAVEALTHWKKMSLKTGPDDPVFPDPKTGWWCTGNAARNFRDDLRAADLSTQYQGKYNFDLHSTRRTFLTLLDDAGVSTEAASAMVGHAKKGVRKHYVKSHVERFVREIEKLPFDSVVLSL